MHYYRKYINFTLIKLFPTFFNELLDKFENDVDTTHAYVTTTIKVALID